MHDVTLCDLVVEGANDPDPGTDPNSRRSYRSGSNRGGIIFLGQYEGQMKNITLRNVTVRNCTYNGVFISGAQNLNIQCCDFNENGASVVPGPRLQHNLLLIHCSNISIKDSRMDTSPHGCGIAFTNCADATITNCELARNAWFGALVTESKKHQHHRQLGRSKRPERDHNSIPLSWLRKCEYQQKSDSLQQRLWCVESYAGKNIKVAENKYAGNGTDLKSNEKINAEKYIIMQ